MPLYEYVCEACECQFELLIHGGQKPVCPTCGGKKLEKQFSVPAAHVAHGGSLPICEAPRGGCGLPQCGSGGCAM